MIRPRVWLSGGFGVGRHAWPLYINDLSRLLGGLEFVGDAGQVHLLRALRYELPQLSKLGADVSVDRRFAARGRRTMSGTVSARVARCTIKKTHTLATIRICAGVSFS